MVNETLSRRDRRPTRPACLPRVIRTPPVGRHASAARPAMARI